MKTLLFFVFGVLAASHDPIELNMEVELVPGEVIRPRISVREGDWASLTQGQLELRVRAIRTSEEAVNVEAEIRENVKGVPVLKGIPSVLTPWGKPAEIRAENKNKTLKYRFKVTAKEG